MHADEYILEQYLSLKKDFDDLQDKYKEAMRAKNTLDVFKERFGIRIEAELPDDGKGWLAYINMDLNNDDYYGFGNNSNYFLTLNLSYEEVTKRFVFGGKKLKNPYEGSFLLDLFNKE